MVDSSIFVFYPFSEFMPTFFTRKVYWIWQVATVNDTANNRVTVGFLISRTDKTRWIEAFKPSTGGKDGETVYESWGKDNCTDHL